MKKLAILVPLIFSNICQAQVSPTWTDINYAGGDTLSGHLLDIYLPGEGDGSYPVIVAIAGSAWFSNDSKERAFQIAKPLLDDGFAIVATNHRSSREAIFPAQINDIKAVVRFIRANAEKYQLNTNFLGIMGDSSGGHLSAMMGLTGGVKEYTVGDKTLSIEGEIGEHLDQSSRVDAVTDWYGPTDFLVMDECGSSFSHDAPDSPESTLAGGPIQQNKELVALANPITYIDSEDPPFLILHGDEDPLVPHCQSELLHEALNKHGVENELIIVPGGGHGDGMWEEPYINQMRGFFVEQKNQKLGQ